MACTKDDSLSGLAGGGTSEQIGKSSSVCRDAHPGPWEWVADEIARKVDRKGREWDGGRTGVRGMARPLILSPSCFRSGHRHQVPVNMALLGSRDSEVVMVTLRSRWSRVGSSWRRGAWMCTHGGGHAARSWTRQEGPSPGAQRGSVARTPWVHTSGPRHSNRGAYVSVEFKYHQ